MAFKFAILLAIAFLCMTPFASFTYLYSMNGSNPGDSTDYFRFSQPTGILFANGKLYVTDSGKGALYVMNGTLRQRLITRQGSENELVNPLRMTYDNGTIYIADGISGKIKYYKGDGTPVDTWTMGSTNLAKPSGIAFDGGNAYITDLNKGNLYVYSRATRAYSSTGIERGGSDGQLSAPADLQIYNNRLFISDSEKKLIYVYSLNLTFLSSIGRGGGIALTAPRGFDIYQDRVYVADSASNRIVAYTMDGYPVEILNSSTPGGNLSYPEDVAISDGKMYVAESGSRIVRVFAINASAGNETVAWMITTARNSLSSLFALQEVAARVNVGFQQGTVAQDVEDAQSYYDRYMFSTASNLAQKAIGESSALQSDLSQKVEVGIKKIAKDSQDSVSQYRSGAKGMVETKIIRLDNMAADVNAKASAKMYSTAADTALSMPGFASEILAIARNASIQDEQVRQNITISLFYLQANSLDEKLAQIEGKAAAYRQQIDTTNIKSLLDASVAYAKEGDYDAANRSLTLAALELSLFDGSISANAREIDAALGNLTAIEFTFNSIAAKPTLVPASIENERSQIAQAKETVYVNPSLAIIVAKQASDSALTKMVEAQAISTAVAALLIMLGLTAIIAIVFYLHIKRRKDRGL